MEKMPRLKALTQEQSFKLTHQQGSLSSGKNVDALQTLFNVVMA